MTKIVPPGDSIVIIKDLNNLKSSILTNYIEKFNLNEIEDIISLKNLLASYLILTKSHLINLGKK